MSLKLLPPKIVVLNHWSNAKSRYLYHTLTNTKLLRCLNATDNTSNLIQLRNIELKVKRHLLLSSLNYVGNVDEKWKERKSSLRERFDELTSQIVTKGIDSVDDKYIPLKLPKQKADGDADGDTAQSWVDYKNVRVMAGNGGDGCINLQRVWCNAKAGPAGGDGGNGGHVFFKTTRNRRCLSKVLSQLVSAAGENGRSADCHGKSAESLVVEVPVGTMIEHDGRLVADLEEEGDMFLAARGGAGGKGNTFFTNSIDQAPKVAEYGGRGEVVSYEIHLRTIADVGLVGIPNAGKSSLLRAVTRARPQVAPWAYTTVRPGVGMVQYMDMKQLAIADIPGIDKETHIKCGELAHISRCSCLLYVMDASQEQLVEQFQFLKNELELYECGLSRRPHAIVLNKMDIVEDKSIVSRMEETLSVPVIGVSAKLGHNTILLLATVRLLTDEHHNTQSSSLELQNKN